MLLGTDILKPQGGTPNRSICHTALRLMCQTLILQYVAAFFSCLDDCLMTGNPVRQVRKTYLVLLQFIREMCVLFRNIFQSLFRICKIQRARFAIA